MKKIILTLLVTLMVLTVGVVNVSADGDVAKIGKTEYPTFAAAIGAAPEETETTITMIADTIENFSEPIIISGSKKITIDLNGHAIEGKKQVNGKDFIWVENGCELTIIDSGTNGLLTSDAYNAATIYVEGKVTLESGTVKSTGNPDADLGGCVFDVRPNDFGNTQGYVYRTNETSLIINGGVVYGNNSNTIRITNSAVELTRKNQQVNVVMNGGTIENGGDAFFIQLWTGIKCIGNLSLEINGGELKCKRPIRAFSTSWTSNKEDGQGSINIAINGGKIQGYNGDVGKTYWKGVAVQNIAGGGTVENVESFMNVAIKGGYYSYNNTLADGLLEGYEIVDNEDLTTKDTYPYMIGEKEVAKIGDIIYHSLADAIAAITEGTRTTITMIDNETIEGNTGVTIPVGKNIVLDLNGKTIKNHVVTNGHSQVINNKGTLTIKDSSDSGNGTIKNEVEVGVHPGDPASGAAYNYTTNIIENNGILTIVSGNLVNTATGSACYAIDNNSADGFNIECYIKGGLLQNLNYTPVRVAPTNSNTIKFEMSGGIVSGAYGIVFNGNNATDPKLHFEINGGTVNASEYAVYTSSMGTINPLEATDFSFTITGGNFGTVKDKASLIEIANIENFISGGWFTEGVKDTYVASGYKASNDLTGKGAPNSVNVYTVIRDVPAEELDNKETGIVKVGGKDIDTTFGTKVTIDETLPPEEKAKISSIQVSNLNKAISTTEKNDSISSAAIEAKDATSPTAEVEVIMNVELAKSSVVKSLAKMIEEDKVDNYNPDEVEYIDISIDKIVKANGNVIEIKEIKKTDSYQLISFPVASVFGTSADKEKVFVYRNHIDEQGRETNVSFTKVEKDYGPIYNGECYWIDGDSIYVKAYYFSVYGFGIQNTIIPAEKKPSPSPSHRYSVPNTGIR